MKKVAYYLLFLSSVCFSQGMSPSATITLTAETDDTTYYYINLSKTDNSSLLMFDYTGVSNEAVQILLYYLDISSTDTIVCLKSDFDVTFPLTLTKGTTAFRQRFFGKTSYVVTFNIKNWKTNYLGYTIIRNDATGTIKRRLIR